MLRTYSALDLPFDYWALIWGGQELRTFALVPLKLDSERLPGKNFLTLGAKPLAHHLLDTLVQSELFEEIFIHASDERIMERLPKGLSWLPRPKELDGSQVKANELFNDSVSQIGEAFIFQTQVTAPFLSFSSIKRGLDAVRIEGFDSSTSVTAHKTFAWLEGSEKPLNYELEDIPRTQDIRSVLLETSGFYCFKTSGFLERRTRIHGKTKFIELGFEESVDIDYPEDFLVAQAILQVRDPQWRQIYTGRRDVNSQNFDKLVAFDLDGVLLDSLPGMKSAWEQAMSITGLDIAFKSYASQLGLPFPTILENLGVPKLLRDQVTETYFASSAREELAAPYPDTKSNLERLIQAGFRLAVLTSKPMESANRLISEHFEGLFSEVISPEQIVSGRAKPAPDGLLQITSSLGIDPKKTVYVGDMGVDYETANRANIEFFHAAWGYGEIDERNLNRFSSLGNLVDWMTR